MAEANEYAVPQSLVDTSWVAKHAGDEAVRLVEVDVDTDAYGAGHVPGAVGWNWTTQLADPVQRDILGAADFRRLMQDSGVGNDHTVVLYGDNNNWFAAWALWQMKIYRHHDVRIMDGGRKKWLQEGRELSTERPRIEPVDYQMSEPDTNLRALLADVQQARQAGGIALVDVRSADEFSGKILAPPGLPETCQRGGHIPGASNIPWSAACNDDGTFKSAEELAALYGAKGVTRDAPVIAYCRIGERSSHTWFVLKYLLGCKDVKNYDGSWTEWGNLVGAPVQRGE